MLKKLCTGFTLIELMIVIVIISILVVIALPSYKKYVMRARFAEVITATQPYKIAVSLALQEGYDLHKLNDATLEIATPQQSKNVAKITVSHGVITALGTSLVNNASYILTPNIEGNIWSITGTCITQGLCNN